MKNTKDTTAAKAGVSRRHLDYLLNGERDASPALCIRLERITGIKREMWNFGSKSKRIACWNKFEKEQKGQVKVTA